MAGVADATCLVRVHLGIATIGLDRLVAINVGVNELLRTFGSARSHCSDLVRNVRGTVTM